jgi:sec-independent protein translocase protein TatB
MLSIPHLIVIFVVALVVFGPEKIPELARNLGKIMAEFRRVTGDLRSTFEGHLRDLEREADQRRIAAPPQAAAPTTPAAPATPDPAAPPEPGTVVSNPPNAAAVAPKPEPIPGSSEFLPGPGEPMHDPYLTHEDFSTPGFNGESSHSESDEKSARVSDGDSRAS